MTQQSPPRWMEVALAFLLPPRDRETIPGDLLEEYREEQGPRLGALGANLWYLRQCISFLSIRSIGGPPMRAALTAISLVTAVTGLWLAVMENILKHAGYGGRTAVAAGIVVQAVATLVFLMLDRGARLRVVVAAGAVGIGALGISAITRDVTGPHFEGFVLIAGAVLVAQAVMTLAVLLRQRPTTTA